MSLLKNSETWILLGETEAILSSRMVTSWARAGHFAKATTAEDCQHPQSVLEPRMGMVIRPVTLGPSKKVNRRPQKQSGIGMLRQ